ncbi:hypothetical protein CYMTET_10060 [Cymbomonas tetramitiformis]|uniref:Alanine--tRNA ligase n=1 Tax=Cymbomonas tetramitiformis TaxID=36881 RepID=A0AAE0GQ69_9CHLO|nr:hypothetical protein CYMTET_10060 [Cymbomonas tetramitiformis]
MGRVIMPLLPIASASALRTVSSNSWSAACVTGLRSQLRGAPPKLYSNRHHRERAQRSISREGTQIAQVNSSGPLRVLCSATADDQGSSIATAVDNSGQGIRRRFKEFFAAREHLPKPSGSLVPEDPTVLLTIAGMLPFKQIFLGQEVRPAPRVTTSQKCIRTNDIENVGVTKRHHTFFEMLGNFSFGDYFKREAITWAWELSTKEYGLPVDRVWVSVFREDDEAYNIWKDVIGVPPEHIQRMDEADNFWASGPTGPCGPCSELYYDFKPELGHEGASLEDDERFIEFYNLVFMESNRDASGVLTPLENKNIDTGMGLERMAQILQEKPNNYETDLIMPIIDSAAQLAGIEYSSSNERIQTYLKVIGDHTRAVVYLISDGVLPSNVGRGYIVRRLLRRVVRCGRLIGIKGKDAFTPKVAAAAIALSGDCDPAVAANAERIFTEMEREEMRFVTTLERGEELLTSLLDAAAKASKEPVLAGKDAFLLYDTYGFPLEITEEVAMERGIAVDLVGFKAAMEDQRKMSQAAVVSVDLTTGKQLADIADTMDSTEFLGYTSLSTEGVAVRAILKDGTPVESAAPGEQVQLVLDRTPFYAESGGQIGDRGTLGDAEVTDVQKAAGGRLFVHSATLKEDAGNITVGDTLAAEVDSILRRRVQAHHTATHLLQSSLKMVLGEDTAQAGSLVTSERLRFDFNAPEAVTPAQLQAIEEMINTWIGQSHEVNSKSMPIAEAKEAGATAMFGEKYGAEVRVVDVPNVSMELCGGTHVSNLAEIGGFKILSEAGIASGVRRIEAVAGSAVMDLLNQRDEVVRSLSSSMRVTPEEVVERVAKMQEDAKAAAKQIADLKAELALAKADTLASEAVAVGDAQLLVRQLDGVDAKSLSVAAENLLAKLGDPGAVVLGSAAGSKVALVAAFSPAVVKQGLKAGQVIGAAAKLCGGGGGGKPNFAQAGGKDASKLGEALEAALTQMTEGLSE